MRGVGLWRLGMDTVTDALGAAFALLYVSAPLLFVAACGVLAVAGLGAAAGLGVALAQRRWRAAGLAAVVVAITAAPARFLFGFADGLAWPGRFVALQTADLAGTYTRPPADLSVHLSPEGGFSVEGTAWALPWREGTWHVEAAEGWGPAHHAGQVVVTDDGGDVVGALSVTRPLALQLGKAELTRSAHAHLRDQQRAAGQVGGDYLAFSRQE